MHSISISSHDPFFTALLGTYQTYSTNHKALALIRDSAFRHLNNGKLS